MKFTEFEQTVIEIALNAQLGLELDGIKEAESTGKRPIMAQEYIQHLFKGIKEKVKQNTGLATQK